jgi:hypothetical protein
MPLAPVLAHLHLHTGSPQFHRLFSVSLKSFKNPAALKFFEAYAINGRYAARPVLCVGTSDFPLTPSVSLRDENCWEIHMYYNKFVEVLPQPICPRLSVSDVCTGDRNV